MAATTHLYAIGIGSNRRGRHGSPGAEVRAAMGELPRLIAASPIQSSAPLGPSTRRFANAVALIETDDTPPELLAHLKRIEHDFGRRPGQRWGARVIDLDILLWSGGIWTDGALSIPHPAFRARRFVLDPLASLAPDWRDPVTGFSVRQLAYRLRAVDRRPRRP